MKKIYNKNDLTGLNTVSKRIKDTRAKQMEDDFKVFTVSGDYVEGFAGDYLVEFPNGGLEVFTPERYSEYFV